MFGLEEHHALLRLMTRATGWGDDGERIAHWLQEWERSANPRAIKSRVPGLTGRLTADVQTIAQAVKQTGLKPSMLGHPEYDCKMETIARNHPLPREYER